MGKINKNNISSYPHKGLDMDIKNIEYKKIFVTISNPERSNKTIRIPFPCYAHEAYYAKDTEALNDILEKVQKREQKQFKVVSAMAKNFLSNSEAVQLLQCDEFLSKLRMFESVVKTWKEYLAEKVAIETVLKDISTPEEDDPYFIDEDDGPTVVPTPPTPDSDITPPDEGDDTLPGGDDTVPGGNTGDDTLPGDNTGGDDTLPGGDTGDDTVPGGDNADDTGAGE